MCHKATEIMTCDGAFRNLRCGRLAPADVRDDADLSEWGHVWEDQIRAMLHD